MKTFEIPQLETIRFAQMELLTEASPDCTCVECLPCENGDHCTYYDTCPTYCARDGR